MYLYLSHSKATRIFADRDVRFESGLKQTSQNTVSPETKKYGIEKYGFTLNLVSLMILIESILTVSDELLIIGIVTQEESFILTMPKSTLFGISISNP